MEADCLFCKFVRGEIKPDIIYEDDQVLVFHDIKPEAPIHALVIPKKHIDSVSAIPSGDPIVSVMTETAVKVAAELGIAQEGFRLVFNNGHNGGQTISHLHLHLLGGRPMGWPPG
jgi:histidine triad (HIT) family protein